MPNYVWNNSAVSETTMRFAGLTSMYDPITIRHIEKLGIRDGWSCLEVGGGNGSIARWLSKKVAKDGHVLVTDLDTRFLTGLKEESRNLEVLQHDIAKDELPNGRFDLAHARLVLIHVPQCEEALSKMIGSLKSGGWILIEDFDGPSSEETLGTDYHPQIGKPPTMSTPLFQKLLQARRKVMSMHGADVTYARRLYGMLRSRGLKDVGMEGHTTI